MINMTVKAKNHAVVFDSEGVRVPEDRFVTVPMSPGLVRAVKDGDLEEVEHATTATPGLMRRRRPEAQQPG